MISFPLMLFCVAVQALLIHGQEPTPVPLSTSGNGTTTDAPASPSNGTTTVAPLNSTVAPQNFTTIATPAPNVTSSPSNNTFNTSAPNNSTRPAGNITTWAPANSTTLSPIIRNGTWSANYSNTSAPSNNTKPAENITTWAPANSTTLSPIVRNGTSSIPMNGTTSAPANSTTQVPSRCVAPTLPSGYQEDQDIVKNNYVTLTTNVDFHSYNFIDSMCTMLCIPSEAMFVRGRSPTSSNSTGTITVTITIQCAPQHNCNGQEKMQVLGYMLDSSTSFRRAYGVVAVARGSNSAEMNPGASRSGDDGASKAVVISMIVLGVLVVVVIVAIVAVVIVRRNRGRGAPSGTHVDFSPQHPREISVDYRPPEFSKLNGESQSERKDPVIVMELYDVEVVKNSDRKET